jgi:hypothetical protein
MYVAPSDDDEDAYAWMLVGVLAHPIIEEGESHEDVTLEFCATSAEAHAYARSLIAMMGGTLIHQFQPLPGMHSGDNEE